MHEALVRYCCRLTTASEISHEISDPNLRKEILSQKRALDQNAFRNVVYRAVWHAVHHDGKLARVAAHHGVDPGELQIWVAALHPDQIAAIKSRKYPGKFSDDAIAKVLKTLRNHIRFLAYTKLRFLTQNDAALTKEDVEAELRCHAISIIRRYEVENISIRYMTNRVGKGLTNHVLNLAQYHGLDRRNPLRRLVVRRTHKTVWYFCPTDESVQKVQLSTLRVHRKGIYCLVRFTDGRQRYAHAKRLFNTEQDAIAARQLYRTGTTPNLPIIDMTVEHDDWQPTLRSLDAPMAGTTLHLGDVVPAVEAKITSGIKSNNPRVQRFINIIQDPRDPVFLAYAAKHGRDPATLTDQRLALLAKSFCRVTQQDLDEVRKQLS